MTFDINTGLATSLQVQVTADVKLEDVHSHKLLFANSNYLFGEEYQVSENAATRFEEDKPALERLSHDLARTLVGDILENFWGESAPCSLHPNPGPRCWPSAFHSRIATWHRLWPRA